MKTPCQLLLAAEKKMKAALARQKDPFVALVFVGSLLFAVLASISGDLSI